MEKQNSIEVNIEYPVIFIVGSTASGKTKLSIELGKLFSGLEIINADAMQLYQGANIMTAKATTQEQDQVRHHLLDVLQIEKLDFTRKDYCNLAVNKINELHKEKKIPLLVGGTNYFMEAVLYNDYDITENMSSEEIEQYFDQNLKENLQDHEDISQDDPIFTNWLQKNAKEKYEILKKIDPLLSDKIHPNDMKRIENYIKIYLEENILPSKKIISLNNMRNLRFNNSLIFWVKDQNKESLKIRIEQRVQQMINDQGLAEIKQIFETLEQKGPLNFTKGIMQSIGYKEFEPLYRRFKEIHNISQTTIKDFIFNLTNIKENQDLSQLLKNCKECLINSTLQYARKQITFIKNRLADSEILKGHFFLLEFTDSIYFYQQVVNSANKLASKFLRGEMKFPNPESLKHSSHIDWKKYECDICSISVNGIQAWEIHLSSKRHKKARERNAKHQKNLEMKQKYLELKQKDKR